jgi:hypothetical protein
MRQPKAPLRQTRDIVRQEQEAFLRYRRLPLLIHSCPECSLRGRCLEVVMNIITFVGTTTVLCYRKPVKVEMKMLRRASLDP